MNLDFKDKKIWIIIGSIILAFVLIYFLFFNSNSDQSMGADGLFLDVEQSPIEEILGRDVLNLVSKMKGVKLDISIFDSQTFKSLEDFTVEIPQQPMGRRDPFAPL